MLILRGAPALSAFRHGKLLDQLTQVAPGVTGLYAEFAHFADVTGQLLAEEEHTGRSRKHELGMGLGLRQLPVADRRRPGHGRR